MWFEPTLYNKKIHNLRNVDVISTSKLNQKMHSNHNPAKWQVIKQQRILYNLKLHQTIRKVLHLENVVVVTPKLLKLQN